jgi:hypothetical protein
LVSARALTGLTARVHSRKKPSIRLAATAMIPPLPEAQPATFRTTVHGTIFAERAAQLDAVVEGDPLLLIPDPPMEDDPMVWVHRASGDPLGHLPPEINQWLAVWLLRGGKASARALRVHGPDVPSWKRLVIEVHCAGPDEA